MLPFQVGAIEPNRPGAPSGAWRKPPVRVNRPDLSFAVCLSSILVLSITLAIETVFAAKSKSRKDKHLSPTHSDSPGERTIIKLADFDISGDSVELDTNTHTGKLVGNVKMVITRQSQLLGNQNE